MDLPSLLGLVYKAIGTMLATAARLSYFLSSSAFTNSIPFVITSVFVT